MVELVIKLSKRNCEHIKRLGALWIESEKGLQVVSKALLNGTILPEGHGRLGDLDALREEVSSWGMNDYEPLDFVDAIDEADTIIEADKEYEVEIVTRGKCMMCGKELDEGLFFCEE